MRQREQEIVRSVPFISAIPILGRLFERKGIEKTQENLLIFVTATIITRHGEDLVPLQRQTPDAAEGRGRFIENNAEPDETIIP